MVGLVLVKRSDCLVFYFRDGKLHCKNFLTDVEVATAPLVVAVLGVLGRYRDFRKVQRLLAPYSPASIKSTLLRLEELTLLVRKGSAQARQEAELQAWKVWGEEARYFHFATKHAFRSGALVNERSFARALLKKGPQPPQVRRCANAVKVRLPGHAENRADEFERVLLARRTHRSFASGGITLAQLSTILRLTWGVTGYLQWPGLGRLALKTSPSGGARQPIEVYLFALRVAGLARGVYHYRGDQHALERLSRRAGEREVVELCAGQSWVRDCSVLFVMSAVLPRVMWRYHFSRAYRVVLLEAGHFCQTFCLVATWLGLAPFSTAALVDWKLEHALRLNGVTETVLYAAGVGPKIIRQSGR